MVLFSSIFLLDFLLFLLITENRVLKFPNIIVDPRFSSLSFFKWILKLCLFVGVCRPFTFNAVIDMLALRFTVIYYLFVNPVFVLLFLFPTLFCIIWTFSFNFNLSIFFFTISFYSLYVGVFLGLKYAYLTFHSLLWVDILPVQVEYRKLTTI